MGGVGFSPGNFIEFKKSDVKTIQEDTRLTYSDNVTHSVRRVLHHFFSAGVGISRHCPHRTGTL